MAAVNTSRPPVDVVGPLDAVRDRLAAPPAPLDRALLAALHAVCEVHDDAASLLDASRDWWPISLRWALHGAVPARPAAVVRPRNVDEVAAVLRACNDAHVPVTAAGGRSGVCGAAVPVRGGVALDTRELRGIDAVDDRSLLVDAQAGTYGGELERELRHTHGLTIGHWPQSVELSTVGGWIACRAAGQYSTRYGKIEDIVAGLEVVLADGRVVRTGSIAGAGPRAAVGPDLTQLFTGSEGTLGVMTRARLRAHPVPPAERRAAFAFDAFTDGIEALRRTLRRGATPAVVRLYDAEESRRTFNRDEVVLVALDEGDERIVEASMGVLHEECAAGRPLEADVAGHWFETRNDVSALDTVVRMGVVVDTVEVAASWHELSGLYSDAVTALRALEGTVAASAHESHAYIDGACLYFTFAGTGAEPEDDTWAERYYRSAWDTVMRATLAHHGSISHHHGIGIVRAEYVGDALGAGLDVLRAIKRALDPNGILNPGKLGLDGAVWR